MISWTGEKQRPAPFPEEEVQFIICQRVGFAAVGAGTGFGPQDAASTAGSWISKERATKAMFFEH